MSTMDRRILNPHGDRYPFAIPDGYFDNLTARIMNQIPADESTDAMSTGTEPTARESLAQAPRKAKLISLQQTKRRALWLRGLSIAASLILMAVVSMKFLPLSTTKTSTGELTAEYTEEDYNEDLLTYTMADHIDVYDYLSNGSDDY